jgi:hypothetical protein
LLGLLIVAFRARQAKHGIRRRGPDPALYRLTAPIRPFDLVCALPFNGADKNGAEMTRKLVRSLAIPGLMAVLLSLPLTAQSTAPAANSGAQRRLDFWDPPNPANFHAIANRSTKPHPDAVAQKLARVKTYQFRTVDYPAAYGSAVFDANRGTAVGVFQNALQSTAFYFQQNSYHSLSVPGSTASFIRGINSTNQMVGSFDNATGRQGFFYDGTTFTTINPDGAVFSQAFEISDSGVIVGEYSDGGSSLHGFAYSSGTFTTIDYPGAGTTSASGINSKGDIVGTYQDSSNIERGFLLSNGIYYPISFPLANSTRAAGINDVGAIAGTFMYADQVSHGFVYSRGVFHQVDVDGAANTLLYRVENNGSVVGFVTDTVGESHGVIGR